MSSPPDNRIKRDGTADLLKGFAVLFMIQVHIMEQFVSTDVYNSMIGKISLFLGGPVCAPVFLAVMGYFMASSAKPLAYFLKRGLLLFLGGILLNLGRSANLLLQIVRGDVALDPWFFIMGVDILALAGLSLILTGILRLIFRDTWWLFFLAALAVAGVSPWLNQSGSGAGVSAYAHAFLGGGAGWSYFPLFPWFSYVLAGYAFRLAFLQNPKLKEIEIQRHFIYLIPLWIGMIITIPYAATITHDLDGPAGYYHHGILFFGWVILFMIAYLTLMKLVDGSYGENRGLGIVKWIGQKVTVIYVIQWLIIGNLATFLFRSQNLFQFFGWFVAVTIATLFIGFLVEKARSFLNKW
jgi:uncharacterized membrane protein